MAVLAALAVVILVAVPTSTMAIQKYQLNRASADLLTSLTMAYDESVVRSSTVRVCPSSNGHTCRNDRNWDHGWLVFTDGNGDGAVQEFELLKAFPAPHPQVRIRADGAVESRASFTAAGLVGQNDVTQGSFLVCIADSDRAPRIVEIQADGMSAIRPAGTQSCQQG
jgi:Tfp pilus assembly protein FimT